MKVKHELTIKYGLISWIQDFEEFFRDQNSKKYFREIKIKC